MKKIFKFTLLFFTTLNICLAQGRFSATVTGLDNVLTFKLKPNITTTTGFSTIEFFLRYGVNSPDFTYSAVTVNTTNFPGMTSARTTGAGAWEIEHDNPVYLTTGYHIDHFIYTAPAPISAVRSYNAGTEYDLISVSVIGSSTDKIDFQLIHQDSEKYAYLAITGEVGNDLRPLSFTNYFYPLTSFMPGPGASAYYFMNLAQVSLPVKLVSFNAAINGCTVDLNWQTSNETNSAYYAVERSDNNINFMEVGRINSENNTALSSHTFSDAKPGNGIKFYRLRLADVDGKFAYSMVKQVKTNCLSQSGILIYPTLTHGLVNVVLPGGDENAVVRVINSVGEEVFNDGGKGLNRSLNLKRFANGIYLAQVVVNGKTIDSVKIVLQKE